MKKSLLIFFIIFSMLTINVISGNTSVHATQIESDDIGLLNMLGIVKGYEDGELHPEYNITRMEFTALILRCLGIDFSMSSDVEIFHDVPSELWGASYINIAHKMGIIQGYGDGSFRPNENINQVDAVKIVVEALGYGRAAQSEGGYPNGHLSVASKNKILTSGANSHNYATRGYVSELLVNSLSISMMDTGTISSEGNAIYLKSGETILDRLNISRLKGTLEAVFGVNLTNMDNVAYDEIIVANKRFKTKYPVKAETIGENVEIFVYDYNGSEEVVCALMVNGKNTKNLLINAEDISDATTFSEMIYFENNKRKNVKLAPDLKIIYNGMPISTSSEYTTDKLFPKQGFVKLLDSDSDTQGYDIAIVKDYKTYVVKSIQEDAIYDI